MFVVLKRNFFSRKYLVFFLLLSLLLLSNFFSIYIKPWNMRISTQSLFLLVIGFLYGLTAGIASGLLVSFGSVNWWSEGISPAFLFQQGLIGLIGGVFGYLYKRYKELPVKNHLIVFILLNLTLFLISSLLLNNKTLISLLFLFLVSSTFIFFLFSFLERKKFVLCAYICMALISVSYIASFSLAALVHENVSLVVVPRIFKELLKFPIAGICLPFLLQRLRRYGC